MAAKKKTAAKKTTAKKTKGPKEKRPARQFFTAFSTTTGAQVGPNYVTRKAAKSALQAGEKVAGPYVLTERSGQR